MSKLVLAFYRGRGNFLDRAIRFATGSPYSHVELVMVPPKHVLNRNGHIGVSASSRDGGVREKQILFKQDHWDFLPVKSWSNPDAWSRASNEIGHPYDYVGILFNFAIPLRRHLRTSWFCSEICGYAVGIPDPHTLSPGELYDRVRELNHTA